MFLDFLLFEIKFRLHRVSTYVYFAVWFFMTFFSIAATNFGPIGTGKVLLNGPYALTTIFIQLTAFGTVVLSAIFGTAILRDFQQNTYPLIFTKPISKFDYLGGRWAGSMFVSALIFLGLPLGAAAGAAMPWVDKARLETFQLWHFLQPFLSFTLIQIFFLGSLFFCVAALTRRLFLVYLQGIAVFALYLIWAITVLNGRSLQRFWPSVFDPLGLILLEGTTRYWTVVEKNTMLLGWTGAVVYNRLLWLGFGVLCLLVTFAFFPMSAEELTAKRLARGASRRKIEDAEDEQAVRHRKAIRLAHVSHLFGARGTLGQMFTLTRLRFFNIVREIPFWGIALIMIVLTLLNGHSVGRFRDTATWPVTYLMVEVVAGSSMLFLMVIATLYAGELIWRERDVQFDQMHDALPLRNWVNFLSQFLALAVVEAVLLAVVIACGVATQAAAGYYHFQLSLYLKELYVIDYPQVLMFVLFALFVQTLVSNKFLGHGLVIGTFLLIPVLYRYGVENRLYMFSEVSPYTYSDMNAYGHFVPALRTSTIYWLSFSAFLGVLAIAFARRGTDLAWPSRWKDARAQMRPLIPAALLFLCVFGASGAWYYYNAHVLNEFRTSQQDRDRQAGYERAYKKYERLAQPKIIAVDVEADIYPERRSISGHGHYTLVNHSGTPISEVHIVDRKESVDDIRFDRPFRSVLQDKRHFYAIYKLDQPLLPNDTMRMDFRMSYTSRGFRDGNERAELAYNGTFFDRDYFPGIGYSIEMELSDPVRRREEKLPPEEELAPRDDPYFRNVNLFTPDSEWITFRAVVSTSADQIAIAPGYLQREWTANGRRYFEYDMGGTRINDFYSFISGRYAVKRDKWHNVNLEIYYQPGHEYNLKRMFDATKKGLDYFEHNFGPYQFTQFRILEYPRYRTFAQSFPNTVPYSEALGFIQRVQKPDDIDETFYITAHELAHQWWGHQLIGSRTQGSNMMSETLAQYSALMLMEKEYGPQSIRKFLKHELDAYLRGRGSEVRKEPPLALVQNEPYVWYNKGSLVMYALRDYIGEDRLNAALRNYLAQNKYKSAPFPDTRSFVECLRAATPPDMQYLISEMFDKIVLFDNKAVSATWTATPDHKYKVELTVNTRKVQADGAGRETEMPVNELVDIAVFSSDRLDEKPLYIEKRKITANTTKITVVVDGKPARAGIDPYNKLIDRNPEDNVVTVSKA